MNAFFTDEMRVSNINLCILVLDGTGQLIHRNRPNHGLVMKLSGVNRYVFANEPEMTVFPGDLFYLPKGSDYEVFQDEPGDCIAVNFELADESIVYPAFVLRAAQGAKYAADFRSFWETWQRRKPGYLNQCYMLLYRIICGVQQEAAATHARSHSRRIADRAAEIIALHLDDAELTVAGIAWELGITPEYFRKIFASVYGASPRKYIVQARVEKAKELLASGEFTVTAIAQMCGYDSAAYFSREFKRVAGCTPTEFCQKIF